ncbi:hypothetical protein MTO96_040759, partial [Rhipicephalus appendiculatus]
EFYEEDEAILASHRKRAAREHHQKLGKEATDKAVRDFHLQKQQQEAPLEASKKKKKVKPKATKRKTKAPLSAFSTARYFRGSHHHKRQHPVEAPAAFSNTCALPPSPPSSEHAKVRPTSEASGTQQQIEKHVVQAIGHWLKNRANSTAPAVSSPADADDSSCVPVPATTDEEEADGAAISRKRGRDDDAS